MDALVAEMGGIVTKQALSKYERGKIKPSHVVLNKLAAALGVKSSYLWREPEIDVRFIAYRKGSGLRRKEQAKVECLVSHTLEERVRLQELTQQFDGSDLPLQSLQVTKLEDADSAAKVLRDKWNLGFDPIASVVGMLEDHLIHVLEIEASGKFDGISAIAYDAEQRVVASSVVTRLGVAGERQRLNLVHELGHIVLDVDKNVDEEKAAFRFATSFLAPEETLFREIGKKRVFIQTEELLMLKKRLGMSIQALLYRLRDLKIITESYYKQWCININRLGWRKREPLELLPEQPQWLRRIILRTVGEELLTWKEAEKMLGETMRSEQTFSFVKRRAFMKLPLEERRRVMAEQAEKMEAYYKRDGRREKFQGGDIVEY